ncbi:hypothetical protein [Streptomyces flaveolus]|uniref:hypothetical protein n=1 Tax=Streptomyces flaveolus TaxID=67297 RepID=UPI0012EDF276|nr:hypothetical protein [Streptomyces flaveolus]
MSGQQSGADVLAAVLLAVALFAASLVPFFLLIHADLSPRRAVRALARMVRRQSAPPRLPHWARTGHLSPSSSAARGRHRRGGTS